MRVRAVAVVLAIVAGVILAFWGLNAFTPGTGKLALVPLPAEVHSQRGQFLLRPATRILVDETSRETGDYLALKLRDATGYSMPVLLQSAIGRVRSPSGPPLSSVGAPASLPALSDIMLTATKEQGLGHEGYQLDVTKYSVRIRAYASAGFFYGVQSLLQLMPPEVFASSPVDHVKWSLPCVSIRDQPRFPWRGLMLDVSRHFFTKDEVKRLLDLMALHKLNVFHWHLVDDQGWRIEIKKYPRLTEVGAWRPGIGFQLDPNCTTNYDASGRYGGFYTQADIRDVVAYAQSRHITIVPEIEMPGHCTAALAAYPELSCSGGPYSMDTRAGGLPAVFCASKEQTFSFVEDVLEEVMTLFPGKFIHIGGDEVTTLNWRDCANCQALMRREGLNDERRLQRRFIERIQTFLVAHGRRLIGWSEIGQGGPSNGGPPAGAAIMDWKGGGLQAALAGCNVVMSPDEFCYFDHYQSRARAAEPPASGAFLPLEKVYAFEPVPANIPGQTEKLFLGAQANVWTEYMGSLAQVEYMTFPRLCALSEVVWSPRGSRDWSDFSERLVSHLERLERLGVRSRRP